MKDQILYTEGKFKLMQNVPIEPVSYGVGDEQYYGARLDEYHKALQACKDSALEIVNWSLLPVIKYTRDEFWFYTPENNYPLKDGDTFELPEGLGHKPYCRGRCVVKDCICNDFGGVELFRLTRPPSEKFDVPDRTDKELIEMIRPSEQKCWKCGMANHKPWHGCDNSKKHQCKECIGIMCSCDMANDKKSEPSLNNPVSQPFEKYPYLMYSILHGANTWQIQSGWTDHLHQINTVISGLEKERDALKEENDHLMLLRTEAYHEIQALKDEIERLTKLLIETEFRESKLLGNQLP